MLANAPESSKAWFYRRAHEILSLMKKELLELAQASKRAEPNFTAGAIKNRQLSFMSKPMGNFWARIAEEQMREDGQV